MEQEAAPRRTNVCGLKSSELVDGLPVEVTRPSGKKFLVAFADGWYSATDQETGRRVEHSALGLLKKELRRHS